MVQLHITPYNEQIAEREQRERQVALFRRRQVFGLLIVAAAILVYWLIRGRHDWLFPPGWWRL